jgi:uncharacterized LabA/DUF88 family protein
MTDITPFTAFFWDYENVGFSESNLDLFLKGLEVIKQKLPGTFILKCFCHWSKIPENTQIIIQNAGFELCQVPQIKKNAVDQAMIVSAVNLSHQISISHFLLISSDGDFSTLCQDLNNKNITISIISRKEISKDLKQYAQFIYFVASQGVLFQFEEYSRDKLIELIEFGVTDAKTASKSLNDVSHENITIFSKKEWKLAYEKSENCQVSPFILDQIFKIDDLYETFLQYFGYGISKDSQFFCLHETSQVKQIQELDIFVDLPESMELRVPIQILPASALSVFKTEYKEPKKPIAIPKAQKLEETIIKTFKKLIKDPKVKSIDLSTLNQETCKQLGISVSQKIYKKHGYSTFKKAVESIKSRLSKKIKIKGNSITW